MKRLYYALFFYLATATVYAAQERPIESLTNPKARSGRIRYTMQETDPSSQLVEFGDVDPNDPLAQTPGYETLDAAQGVSYINQVTDEIMSLQPTKSNMQYVESLAEKVYQRLEISSECAREFTLVVEGFKDEYHLHQYNVNTFRDRNIHNLALLHAMRKLHPHAADILIAENMSKETRDMLEDTIEEREGEEPVESVDEEPQEELIESVEEEVAPAPVPEPVIEEPQVEEEQKEPEETEIELPEEPKPLEPVRIPEAPFEPAKQQPQPEAPQKPEPVQPPLQKVEKQGVEVTQEDVMRVYEFLAEQGMSEEELKEIPIEDIYQMVQEAKQGFVPTEQTPQTAPAYEIPRDHIIGVYADELKNRLIEGYKLRELHKTMYKVAFDAKQLQFMLERLEEIIIPMSQILPAMQAELIRLYPGSKPPQQEFQETLNIMCACIFAAFDALIAGVYDADKQEVAVPEQGFIGSIWAGIWGESEKQKKEKEEQHEKLKIEKLTRISNALQLGLEFTKVIDMFVKFLMPHMIAQEAFEGRTFDVTPYVGADILENGEYLYKRSQEKQQRTLVFVDQFHKKKYTYRQIIQQYLKKVDALVIQPTIEEEVPEEPAEQKAPESPLIKPSLIELEQPKQPELEIPVSPIVEKEVAEVMRMPEPPQEIPVLQPTVQEPEEEEEELEEFEPFVPLEETTQEEVRPEPQEKPVEPIEIPEVPSTSSEEEVLSKEIEDLITSVQQIINTLKERTARLQEAQSHQEQEKYSWAFNADTFTTYITVMQTLSTIHSQETSIHDLQNQFNVALQQYIVQLVDMAFFQESINDMRLETLHATMYQNPFDSAVITEFLESLMATEGYKTVKDTMQAIAPLSLGYDAIDSVIVLLCAVFDAYAAGMMNVDIVQKQLPEGDSVTIEMYRDALQDGIAFFQGTWLAMIEEWIIYTTNGTHDTYDVGMLNITEINSALVQDDTYIYAVEANKPITIQGITVASFAINPLHKKEYESLLSSLITTVESKQKQQAIQNILTAEDITIEALDEQLASLEKMKEDGEIDEETYALLKKQLQDKKQTLVVVEKQQQIMMSLMSLHLPSYGIEMHDLITILTTNMTLVGQALLAIQSQYKEVADQLKLLKEQQALTADMRHTIEVALEYLLGTYDGLFACIYDVIQEHNQTVDLDMRASMQVMIATLLKGFGPMIVTSIEDFITYFFEYCTEEFKTSFNNQVLLIGAAINAMAPLDQQELYIFERPMGFTLHKPSEADAFKKYQVQHAVRLTVRTTKSPLLIVPPEHKKVYRAVLQAWDPIAQEIMQGAQETAAPEQILEEKPQLLALQEIEEKIPEPILAQPTETITVPTLPSVQPAEEPILIPEPEIPIASVIEPQPPIQPTPVITQPTIPTEAPAEEVKPKTEPPVKPVTAADAPDIYGAIDAFVLKTNKLSEESDFDALIKEYSYLQNQLKDLEKVTPGSKAKIRAYEQRLWPTRKTIRDYAGR